MMDRFESKTAQNKTDDAKNGVNDVHDGSGSKYHWQ